MNLLSYDFMQRALVAAAMVGVLAPLIGVFLVQRRLALLGDGMGHVALTGVGLAFLVGTQPVPTALVVAIIGAITVEAIRSTNRAVGDVALALVLYGGIAGGVLLTAIAPNTTSTSLNQYLFGSLATIAPDDLLALAIAFSICILVLAFFWRSLFALSLDAEVARTQGVRVTSMSILLTTLAAVAVVIGMRTVGLLLVAAILIIPVAAAQQMTRSFKATAIAASGIGLFSAIVGLVGSFYLDLPSGPTIVLVALAVFVVLAVGRLPLRPARSPTGGQSTPSSGSGTGPPAGSGSGSISGPGTTASATSNSAETSAADPAANPTPPTDPKSGPKPGSGSVATRGSDPGSI